MLRRTMAFTAAAAAIATTSLAAAPAGSPPLPAPAQKLDRADRPHAFLVELDTDSTAAVARRSSKAAARRQLQRVRQAQDRAIAALPAGATPLYRTHALLAGVAVKATSDTAAADLAGLPGAVRVHPIIPKQPSTATSIPLQGGPQAWAGVNGTTGDGVTIAIIDTGVDFTHANFGGPGTPAAYNTAHAAEASPANPAHFGPGAPKVIGGKDFVGDAYTAAASGPGSTANPDPNPLDCGGHGSHVAGIAAGFGENADGSTYTGAYNAATPFSGMRIGPGMAPRAKLYAYRVFGCDGGTSFTAAAIDAAVDPNGDGDTSDRVDVINMSLGSDFGLPEDPDAILSNRASDLGASVVISAGNDGDTTDVGGSPSSAAKAITVASSMDAVARFDALNYTINGGTQPQSPTVRSVAYDWAAKPDLTGPVGLPPAGNTNGCAAFPADHFVGKVALLEWDPTGNPCSTASSSARAVTAKAVGVVFFSTEGDDLNFGITGSATIPAVVTIQTTGQAMRAAITGAQPVTVTGTTTNGIDVSTPENTDRPSRFTSRGIRDAGNLKPDVAAVGDTVFSTAVGTGADGMSISGTSMAAPAVAGLAALVRQRRPGWTPEQVKATIVNTAGQDIDTNGSATAGGDRHPPVRVGTGRIKAKDAVDNEVLAFSAEDAGVASVGFGALEIGGPTTRTKRITVRNTGASSATYTVAYNAITTVPGVSFAVSPGTVTVGPNATQTIDVTLTVTDLSQLTKAVDPTVGRQARFDPGYPRETLAEASGRVLLTPTGGGRPPLRVAVHAAPRPTAAMTQPGTLEIFGGTNQTATLPLTGSALGQAGANGTGNGDAADDIVSLAAGFELVATDDDLPACAPGESAACIKTEDDLAGDLRHVGYTSNAPVVPGLDDRVAWIAVTMRGAAAIPTGRHSTFVDLDVDEDGTSDWTLALEHYPSRTDPEDLFVSVLYDKQGAGVNADFIDGRSGERDAAIYDSDVLFLPVRLKELAAAPANTVTAADPRVRFSVTTYSQDGRFLDDVGRDDKGVIDGSLRADLYNPGVLVRDGTTTPTLVDKPGPLTVQRNLTTYRADGGKGLLMLHLHNKVGEKAQVVTLRGKLQTVAFTSTAPTTAAPRDTYTPAATGGASGKPVVLSSATPGVCTFAAGTVTFVAEGTCTVKADQAGDDDHEPGSATQSITVAKLPQTVLFQSASPSGAKVGDTYAVSASADSGLPATFSSATAQTCSVSGATVTFTAAGTCTVAADQPGDDRFAAAPTVTQTIEVVAAPGGGGGGGGGGSSERAASSTALVVAPAVLSANVAGATAGLGFPTGTVSFTVDGAAVGSAPVVAGVATLAHKVPTGATRKLVATYSGDAAYLPSSAAADRNDPTVTTTLKSAKKRSRFGWYSRPVTVSFTCTPRGSALAAACPKPVTLSRSAARQSVSRTVTALDGGGATARVQNISIDRVKPTVRITVKRGKPKCVGKDKLSKLASCKLSKRAAKGGKTRWTAKATDRAGNTRSVTRLL